MSSRPLLSLVLALLFGAAAAFLARGLIGAGAQGASPRQTLVVASRPIPFGAPLTADNLREVSWPNGVALDGAFSSVPDVLRDGRRLALGSLQPNEAVLAAKVTAPNGRATLSTQIDEGMRAVSIRVDEVRGVAGFVLPGDRVDVILARDGGGAQGEVGYADLLLRNAKVLAVDQLAVERQDKPTVARAVTLEVSVADAQKVVLAQGVGRLSLILRQVGETDRVAARRVTVSDLGPGAPEASSDRIAELEKKLAAATAAAEQSTAQARLAANQRISDLEARLMARTPAAAAAPLAVAKPAAAKPADPVINVIRNGAKREQYTVVSER